MGKVVVVEGRKDVAVVASSVGRSVGLSVIVAKTTTATEEEVEDTYI